MLVRRRSKCENVKVGLWPYNHDDVAPRIGRNTRREKKKRRKKSEKNTLWIFDRSRVRRLSGNHWYRNTGACECERRRHGITALFFFFPPRWHILSIIVMLSITGASGRSGYFSKSFLCPSAFSAATHVANMHGANSRISGWPWNPNIRISIVFSCAGLSEYVFFYPFYLYLHDLIIYRN